MTVYIADVHAHVQRLVSVVKMATVLKERTAQDQRSAVRFLWEKGPNAKDIHKEMCSVYGGKCLSCKAVYKWVEKCGRLLADDEEAEMEVRKWLRQHPKDFYAVVMRWDKTSVSMLVDDISRNKCFFQVQVSHVLRFRSICDVFSDSIMCDLEMKGAAGLSSSTATNSD
jgi:hypothetical protein